MRIHFTVEDLARLRMVAGLGPLTEGIFALHRFSHSGSVLFHPWRMRVRAALRTRTAELEALAQQAPSLTELTELLGPSADGEGQSGPAALLGRFTQVAVLPYWTEIRPQLERVRDARGRIAIAHGSERLLSAIHPTLRWNAPVLEVRGGPDRDVHLGGRGLVLSPSFFLNDPSCVFIDDDREAGGPAVYFPIGSAAKPGIWDSWEADEQALGALVGHTRAAALQALTDSCTTGELAERLGISLAGASKHAAVLRRAGLITTARNRNTALHTLTTLGMALLQSRELVPMPFRSHQRTDIPA
ncbi:ArsR/SmtB family transcription factor [Streptomyces sp. NRRL S-350]|uniref:ArsR/SmtB family transcription factor n=1 Tax=Streptomyces sp. NRRL S-350 TaxID=1463902 RepID=UPI00131CDFC8|nr:winged helix-turn-helix domain-containing protein [Streptomyces sp. NRRL S-350]